MCHCTGLLLALLNLLFSPFNEIKVSNSLFLQFNQFEYACPKIVLAGIRYQETEQSGNIIFKTLFLSLSPLFLLLKICVEFCVEAFFNVEYIKCGNQCVDT